MYLWSTLQLEGKIVAPLNKAAWSDFKSYEWVSFNKIIGLTVLGSGTINGRGSSFWEVKYFLYIKRNEIFLAVFIIRKCGSNVFSHIQSIQANLPASKRPTVSTYSCSPLNWLQILLLKAHSQRFYFYCSNCILKVAIILK